MMGIQEEIKLAEIRERIAELNAQGDAANAQLERVERDLRGLGVEVWLDNTALKLGYAETEEGWGIAVDGYSGPIRIFRMKRSVRINAVKELPGLIDEIHAEIVGTRSEEVAP